MHRTAVKAYGRLLSIITHIKKIALFQRLSGNEVRYLAEKNRRATAMCLCVCFSLELSTFLSVLEWETLIIVVLLAVPMNVGPVLH